MCVCGSRWMCTSSRSWPRRCRRRAARPRSSRIETTRAAIRRFIDRLGGPEGLAVCYEAGPGGFALWRLLTALGVACDVIAPSLVPVRAGDRVKTDRRDAKKLVRFYRGGRAALRGAADARDTRGCATCCAAARTCAARATAARHRVAKQLLRHGRIFRDGKKPGRSAHRAWVARQRLDDPLAQLALEQMLRAPGRHRAPARRARRASSSEIAASERWAGQVARLLHASAGSRR